MATVLQYVPFSSMVEPGFWHKLSENKLNVYGLDDKPRQIKGFYFNGKRSALHLTSLSFYFHVKKPVEVLFYCAKWHVPNTCLPLQK